ncbi:hypothetical protein F4808DRAFT_466248 [Astrocystis sublimbata]|nr:hypothetical protein F4808DRAFT_466248 [Astrocystis sublimbata]
MSPSTLDYTSVPFSPLEGFQSYECDENYEWPVHFKDANIVQSQPMSPSIFDYILSPFLPSEERQPDGFIDYDSWLTRLGEPQIDDYDGFDWPELPELAHVTCDTESNITDEEILRFYAEQAPTQPIAQKEGLAMVSGTQPQIPPSENEQGASPHKTTIKHYPRSVHHEPTATPYLQEEVKEAVKVLVVMMLILGHVASHNYTQPVVPGFKRKREGSYP